MGKATHNAEPQTKNTKDNMTLENRTEPESVTIAEKTLEHINWTGLTLFELIEAGRIHPEPKEIMPWIKSACGEAADMDQLKTMKEAAKLISERFLK